jgi:hypothetical protein
MDAAWWDVVRKAADRVLAQWPGDPDDVAGQARALWLLIPPSPPGLEKRLHWCERCGMPTEYTWDFDASFCRWCNRWIDQKCKEANCEFCAKRPDRPLPED